ncbi:hypothetical protein P3T39_004516 [Kitasatospora sp. GP82]|nr:hypothetical protein [Kitasatospora sp. GP82]
MGRVGSALDSAAAESFNSLIKVEYIRRHQFATRTEARLKIATWISGFYNPRRRHSAAAGLPPVEFETDYREMEQALGLGDYEGRTYRGFHHHVTLVSAAHLFCLEQRLNPKEQDTP